MQAIKTNHLIGAYLLAIVVANLSVAHFGQIALVFTGLVLIPFDFVTRDLLHDRWKFRDLYKRIGLLILSGAIITTILNADAINVAFASVVAFSAGTLCNTFLYSKMYHLDRVLRMTRSNAVTSVIDSTVFPLLAFGFIDIRITIAQILFKTAGAYAWALVVRRLRIR